MLPKDVDARHKAGQDEKRVIFKPFESLKKLTGFPVIL
jgi:hypothetical protein